MSFPKIEAERRLFLKVAILPITAHFGLLILHDLSRQIFATLALLGLAFLGMLVAEKLLRTVQIPLVVPILCVAALLRVILLPVPPTLSDDIFRYVWDGRVVVSGGNPYQLMPEAAELSPMRDEVWQQMSHRDIPTVYPPLAQLVFALAAILPASVTVLKLVLIGLDMVTCGILFWLIKRWSLPPTAGLWYAWNPLATLEIAGMGHIDALAILAVMLTTALICARPRGLLRAAVTAAAAVAAKLIPVLAFPTWARQTGRPAVFLGLAGAVTLVGLWPMLWSTGGAPPGVIEFGVSWEFNGPIFEPLWRLLDQLNWSALVEKVLDHLKGLTGRHDFWNLFYPLNYPQFWAKIVLLIGLIVTLVSAWRIESVPRSLQRVFGGLVLFSSTVYPWYALWVLPWAALTRTWSWMVLTGLLMLSYIPQFTEANTYPWFHTLIWGSFLLSVVMEKRWSTR